MNKKVIWEEGDIDIVRRGVRIRKMGKGIGGSHGHAWSVNESEIEIL